MWPFKKKDEIAELEKELGLPENRTGLEEPKEEAYDNLGEPPKQDTLQESPTDSLGIDARRNVTPLQPTNTDLQLISAKLDTLKVMLESINQRLDNLEKKEEKHKLWQ